MSSGVSERLALYSGKMSRRKLPPGGSNATPNRSGLSRFWMSRRNFTKPNTTEVFIPSRLRIGRPKKA